MERSLCRQPNEDGIDSSDNDFDGLADCDDPTCAASPECSTTQCANETLPSTLPLTVEGELTIEDHVNRFQICGKSKTRQRIFAWQAPVSARVVVDTDQSQFASRVGLRRGTCFAPDEGTCPEYDFYDGWKFVSTGIDVTAGEWIYVVLGGSADSHAFGVSGQNEHYVLKLREAEPEVGEKCADGLDNDGDGRGDESDEDCWED